MSRTESVSRPRIPPENLAELADIWTYDKRLPTVNSRRAWCKARNLDYGLVNRDFWWRKRRARCNVEISTDTYELEIGTPPYIPGDSGTDRRALSRTPSLISYPPTPEPEPPSSEPVTSISDASSDSEFYPEPLFLPDPYYEDESQVVGPYCSQGIENDDDGEGFTCDLCRLWPSFRPGSTQDISAALQKLEALYPFYFKKPSPENEIADSLCTFNTDRPVLWQLSAIPFETFCSSYSST
ncbi:hypothetical protein BDZ89DRAFT_1112982 [Hymenopellis radicata]|nr:hypothetical protein BDZ89DRAFT_1112982 [Hymenopellis radicata]